MVDGETITSAVGNNGDITSYFCELAVANNPNLNRIYVPFAFEMMYNCSNPDLSESDGMLVISETVLFELATDLLGLGSAPPFEKCYKPQQLWFAKVDSEPPDKVVPNAQCGNFNITNQPDMCCVVVQGNMTFSELSPVEEFMDEVYGKTVWGLEQANGTADYFVSYLGVDAGVNHSSGEDFLGEASVNSDKPVAAATTEPSDGSAFTLVGAFVLLFLSLSICAVLALIIQRRRKGRRASEFGFAVSKSGETDIHKDEDETMEDWFEPRRLPTMEREMEKMEINVFNDEDDIYVRAISAISFHDSEQTSAVRGNSSSPRHYRFDFDDTQEQKENLLNDEEEPNVSQTNLGITVVPAYPSEIEFSEQSSEIDSWAQSQGTIGSLDLEDNVNAI